VNNFIARANIDHFLELLKDDDLSVEKRSVICKLLIEEENKLSRDLEQLEFAQSRAAQCQQRVDQLHDLRNGFTDGSTGGRRTPSATNCAK
jgi:hypothetical protein